MSSETSMPPDVRRLTAERDEARADAELAKNERENALLLCNGYRDNADDLVRHLEDARRSCEKLERERDEARAALREIRDAGVPNADAPVNPEAAWLYEIACRALTEVTVTAPSAADMLREFHEAFGLEMRGAPGLADVPDALLHLRGELLREEAQEYADAAEARDLVGIADALADVVYVAYGNALTYGIDLDAILAEVHRSNMSKLGADGKPILREDGKVLKGPRYFRPDVAGVLGLGREEGS